MDVLREKKWLHNTNRTRKSQKRLNNNVIKMVQKINVREVERDINDKKVTQTDNNLGYYTQSDEQVEKNYRQYVKEKDSLNKYEIQYLSLNFQ